MDRNRPIEELADLAEDHADVLALNVPAPRGTPCTTAKCKVMDGHPVPHDVVVTRGTNLDYLHVAPSKLVGQDLPQDAYISTSLGRTPEWAAQQPYLMHIRVPEGTPASYIGGASDFGDGEGELLIGRGQVIHVDNGIEDAHGQYQVYGHLVGK